MRVRAAAADDRRVPDGVAPVATRRASPRAAGKILVMRKVRLPWREELAIVDRTMRAISGVTDPEELVSVYWENISDLVDVELRRRLPAGRGVAVLPRHAVVAVHRGHQPLDAARPAPQARGGVLGEVAYANRPIFIDDLPGGWRPTTRRFFLEGFASMIAMPQYDGGEGLNVTALLFPPGDDGLDPAMIPMLHWQSGLFGRGTQNLVLRQPARLGAGRARPRVAGRRADPAVAAARVAAVDPRLRARRLLPDELPAPAAITTTSSRSTAAGGACSSPTSPATARRRPC